MLATCFKCRMISLVFLFALVGMNFSAAFADETPPDLDAAKRAFKEGQELLAKNDFAGAIKAFRKAHEITKDDLVLGQIAVAFEKAGDYEGALDAITRYREAVDPADRKEIDRLIRKFQKAISEGKSRKIDLGDAAPPTTPSPTPTPSTQTEVPASTTPEVDPATEIGEGDTTAQEKKEEPVTSSKKRRLFWTWIAAGATVAFTAGALSMGLSAQSKYNDLKDTCSPNCDPSDVSSVKTRALVSDLFWGLTVASAIGATTLFFVEGRWFGKSKETDRDHNDDDDDDDDVALSRLRLTPLLTPSSLGLGATVRY